MWVLRIQLNCFCTLLVDHQEVNGDLHQQSTPGQLHNTKTVLFTALDTSTLTTHTHHTFSLCHLTTTSHLQRCPPCSIMCSISSSICQSNTRPHRRLHSPPSSPHCSFNPTPRPATLLPTNATIPAASACICGGEPGVEACGCCSQIHTTTQPAAQTSNL